MKISEDWADLFFRCLFCSIFVGLGGEHIFSDALIQHLMPAWVPWPRLVSVLCGVWLLGWSSLVLIGYRVHIAAVALGVFLIVVSIVVHVPGLIAAPSNMQSDCVWMYTVLQRSNFVKNVCLLGVCFWLLHHEVGRFSVERWFK